MDKTYTINELALISGLTTRTLRNYLNTGLLNGNKSGGSWKFNKTQIHEFLSHPSVKPSILTKNKAIVDDFLLQRDKKRNEICAVIDLNQTPDEAERLCTLCTECINSTEQHSIRFSFDANDGHTRIILSGPQDFVTDLFNQIKRL